jgi:ABC-2 type transport system ATP-binding protein
MNAIEIKSVKKSYGPVHALEGIDLTLPEGEFFGLLGPNGAGKTTLINCIVGLAKPQMGKISVFGNKVGPNATEARQPIGFSPQEINVDRFFNIRRTLEFQAGFYGYPKAFAKQRAQEMLEQFRLTDKARSPFYKLSGGMQKRLLIARALMSKPKILILDEPTAGIDVEQRYELWEYLRGLNRDGTTILLTTHYIDEAEALCERVAIIDHGRIIEIGKPLELIEKYCERTVQVQLTGSIEPTLFSDLKGVEVSGNTVIGRGTKIGMITGEILQRMVGINNCRVTDIQVKQGSLEEVFLSLTGQPITMDESESEAPSVSQTMVSE